MLVTRSSRCQRGHSLEFQISNYFSTSMDFFKKSIHPETPNPLVAIQLPLFFGAAQSPPRCRRFRYGPSCLVFAPQLVDIQPSVPDSSDASQLAVVV